jgi:hypothetical protein
MILGWADEHRQRTGEWPSQKSGPVAGAEGENWKQLDAALRLGQRGLKGGSSLAKLLVGRRQAPDRANRPPLTAELILEWADAHFARTGRWPSQGSGPVEGASGENWGAVNAALRLGVRGLPGGDSLARFLHRHRRDR